jgi:hypothetical protein
LFFHLFKWHALVISTLRYDLTIMQIFHELLVFLDRNDSGDFPPPQVGDELRFHGEKLMGIGIRRKPREAETWPLEWMRIAPMKDDTGGVRLIHVPQIALVLFQLGDEGRRFFLGELAVFFRDFE